MKPPESYTFLLADDDPDYRMMTNLWLSSANYKVTVVEDGKEALAAVKEYDFDLCLFDVNMPFINGLDLSRQVRVLKPNIPIFLITSLRDENTRQQANTIGVNRFLQKPIEPDQLLNEIAQELGD